jgi:flagellar biosynthesis anti-sigma factor FlgM
MHIPSLDGQAGSRAAGPAVDGARAGAPGAAGAAPRLGDELTLSDSARSIASARRLVDSAPWVRDSRVAAVRDALSGGRYAVDSQELARAIASALT